jgi:VIT1/CCC1 family predicted Fe2+/Mn2+ transporter
MTASEYLAKRDGDSDIAIWQGASTGIAFLSTTCMLLVPFVFITRPFFALAMTYVMGIATIFFFNFVKSRLCGTKFWVHFTRMITVCIIVTVIAFLVGEGAKLFFGIEI